MSRQYKVRWASVAEQDITQIVDYIAVDSVKNAISLFRKIRKEVNSLTMFPKRCRVVPELQAIGIDFYRELILRPYRIIFRMEEDAVFVVGVFDGRRNLEDILLERLVYYRTEQ
ncbi:MAG: type II toxin-antitoxin system RelE/ParE family toxin [bacterium]|nr:type II toxin-antitoxin system RelE/ParE family toxin [bacterium]